MAKILVTGGAGFIGSNLAQKLVEKKHQVTVFDNLATGRLVNLKKIRTKIHFVKGDIRNLSTLERNFRGIDYVFHLAALPGVFLSVQKPVEVSSVNIAGALNVFLAARDNKVRRVIFISSSSVYGGAYEINKEEQKPQPLSPYAVSKITGEYYAANFYQLFGLETVSLRFFNVFGLHQNPESDYAAVIPLFIKLALQGKRPMIFGDGNQSRDFTYIDNVVSGMLLAMEAKKAVGEVFNIACGSSITVNQLVKTIGKILNKKIVPIYKEPRPGDIYRSRADIAKAKAILGFTPKVNFEQGLEKTVAHFNTGL